MGQVETLRELVLSGKQENLEMVRQLVLSPRLHKARGVLRTCGIRVTPELVEGSGIHGLREQISGQACCGVQSRAKCRECFQYVCMAHYLPDHRLCTACGGNDNHHYVVQLTSAMLERWLQEYTPPEPTPRVMTLAEQMYDRFMSEARENIQGAELLQDK